MGRLNIDGQSVGFSFKHENNPIIEKVYGFLKNNTPFILHDGNRIGPVFIPVKLACIDQGQLLIHSGISEFQFSLSFQIGLYSLVDELSLNELLYCADKLLPKPQPDPIRRN